MALKLFQPYVSWKAKMNVYKVLSSGYLSEGEQVKQFEHEFSQRFGFHYVVAVNSGTSALELSYELAGIKTGDEVISPVLTCVATNIPIIRRGAKIVFADIDTDLNINIEDVKKKITPKTKAIVFVHFGGNNRGLEELTKIGKERGITIIEDAAQAVGSPYWGKAPFTAVSLQAIKTLTSGDGGFLILQRKEDFEKARKLRWFGYDREEKQKRGDSDLEMAGYKYHMNDISASIGRGNLADFDKIMEHRRKLAEIYKSYGMFAHSWLAGGFKKDFPVVRDVFLKRGFEVGQYHYRNDRYKIFGGKINLPVMDALEKRYFFVPYHHGVSENDAHRIGDIYQLL